MLCSKETSSKSLEGTFTTCGLTTKGSSNAKAVEDLTSSQEMSDIELQIQAQEHIYRQTLHKEKPKCGRHALEEVGRSLNAIAQRRRQYFLDYKVCNTIQIVRLWHVWESQRNLEANSSESRAENAATRGIKMFLHRVDFYTTLLMRFDDYILQPLKKHFETSQRRNRELEDIKEKMNYFKKKCELILNDNTEINLENDNHSDYEKRFPVISVLRRAHDLLFKMATLSLQWRVHARYEQQFENLTSKKKFTANEKELNEKKRKLRDLDQEIQNARLSYELLERKIGNRQNSIFTTNFPEDFEKCIHEISRMKHAVQDCQANIEATDSTIKLVQQSLSKYKTVGAKKKQKLESSLVRRTKKTEELAKNKAELEQLEEQKAKFDEEEATWLRGGYENAVSKIESLKERARSLEHNFIALENRQSDLKKSYDLAMNQIFELSSNFERINQKYEYVKRLVAMAVRQFYNLPDPLIVAKPNKISLKIAASENAYQMIQPKGVALLIQNDLENKTKNRFLGRPTTDIKKDTGKSLEDLFIQFGYYIIHRLNLSSSEIRQHMIGLSNQYHGYQGNHNSLLLVMVSQANSKGQIIDYSGAPISVNEILEHFVHSRCPALIGKPKLFFFLLKTTVKDLKLPEIEKNKTQFSKQQNCLSADSDTPSHFEPEILLVEEDSLVVRVLFEEDATFADNPTFGGTGNGQEDGIPWFVTSFIKMLADQAGNKDLLSIVRNLKSEFHDRMSPRQSTVTTASTSPASFVGAKRVENNGHLSVFADNTLNKKLYVMPGL